MLALGGEAGRSKLRQIKHFFQIFFYADSPNIALQNFPPVYYPLMPIHVPPASRSRQLRRYHEKVKPRQKTHKKQAGSTYNGGVPRANLSLASDFHKRVLASLYAKRSMCHKEGIPYGLDSHWVLEQLPVCAVTGIPLTHEDQNSPSAVNVDRIDPSKGYIKSNCRLVAKWYNQAKLNWPDEEIRGYILAAAQYMVTPNSEVSHAHPAAI